MFYGTDLLKKVKLSARDDFVIVLISKTKLLQEQNYCQWCDPGFLIDTKSSGLPNTVLGYCCGAHEK